MGHTIVAFKKNNNTEIEVARNRRAAYERPLSRKLYSVLNSTDCISYDVSGNGTRRVFTKTDLQNAKNKLGNNPELKGEIKFINDCLGNIEEEITIAFL